jgi:hypothetical protein
MADKETKYPVTYSIVYHSPPIPLESVPKDHGACSTLLAIAYTEDVDGNISCNFQGINELGQELKPFQLFQIWCTFAAYLIDILPDGGPKDLCKEVRRVITKAQTSIRDNILNAAIEKAKKGPLQ